MKSGRGAYRPKKAEEISAIEARRLAGGFTVGELAQKAGMDERTYRRMRHSGLGFQRRIRSLQMALRTLEGERKRESEVFPADRFRAGAARRREGGA